MPSIDEVKGRLLMIADRLDEAAGFVGGAANTADEAAGDIAGTFEGTGRGDLLELQSRVANLGIKSSDLLIDFLGTATAIRDAVALM